MTLNKGIRVYQQYMQLLAASKKACLSAIDGFNRVHGEYKVETTLMLLTNAWELLSKAILLKKGEDIYEDSINKVETISCKKSIKKLVDIGEIKSNQAEVIQQIISLRNQCTHHVIPTIPEAIQHHLLFFGCKFFKELAIKNFPKTKKDLNKNFLSISFDKQTTYAAQVQKMISKLRKSSASEKELIWLLERGLRYDGAERYISQKEFENLYEMKKKIIPHLKIGQYIETADMISIIPIQAPKNFTADITLRKGSKNAQNTLPVAYKIISDDQYKFFTSEIGHKVNKSTNFIAKAMTHLGIKGNEEYHTTIKSSAKSKGISKYNEEALNYLIRYLQDNPTYNPYKH